VHNDEHPERPCWNPQCFREREFDIRRATLLYDSNPPTRFDGWVQAPDPSGTGA